MELKFKKIFNEILSASSFARLSLIKTIIFLQYSKQIFLNIFF